MHAFDIFVRKPVLAVTKTGPGERFVGRPLPFEEFLGWLQRRPSLHRQLPF